MALRPTSFTSTGFTIVDEDRGHTATVPWSALNYPVAVDGTVDMTIATFTCPTCNLTTSSHPITGGSSPDVVQRAFIYGVMYHATLTPTQVAAAGLPIGYPLTAPRTWDQAKALVKAAVLQRDPNAWQLETVGFGQ